jgi:lysophospholipase L1-like esterase
MLKKGLCFSSGGDCAYWDTPTWPAALESQPNVVTIMLGTNDAKSFNWFGVQEKGFPHFFLDPKQLKFWIFFFKTTL